MEFSLNDTQQLLKSTAERLVRDLYSFEKRKQIMAQPGGWDRRIWQSFAELGLLGIEIGEDQGGTDGDFRDLSVVLEAFGSGLVVEPFLSTVVLGAGIINSGGNDQQKTEYLAKVATGDLRVAAAYEERETRYRLERIAASARRDGEGYVLNGVKSLVLDALESDLMIVAARTDGAPGDKGGITLFLVPAATAGLTIQGYRTMDDRGAGEVLLEDANVPATSVLGKQNEGLALLHQAVDRGAAAVCCDALGAMTAVNALTLEYIKTRQQFGRPIGKFQVIQHRMADMMMAEQQARSMTLLAVDAIVSWSPERRAKAVSAAKVAVSNAAQTVGRGAIQLHGGMGMTIEYAAGHYFRRLTALEKMFGDASFHLERYAAP